MKNMFECEYRFLEHVVEQLGDGSGEGDRSWCLLLLVDEGRDPTIHELLRSDDGKLGLNFIPGLFMMSMTFLRMSS